MEEKDIKEVLEIILERIKDKDFIWRLEGSANLKVQGIKTSIRDLDITTNYEGIKVLRNSLKEFIVKEGFNKKVNGFSVVCNIKGFEVEINSYGDRKKNMFEKNKIIRWKGLMIPILPLKYAKRFYEHINRYDKVKLIEAYLGA